MDVIPVTNRRTSLAADVALLIVGSLFMAAPFILYFAGVV